MKKYLLLLAAFGLFLFSSCSNDDDGGETQEATIEGSWKLASINPPVMDLSCPESPTITFTASGTANWTMYDSENDCAAQSSSGTWVENSDGSYTVGIPGFGDVQGTVNFTSNSSFTFSTSVQGVSVVLSFVK